MSVDVTKILEEYRFAKKDLLLVCSELERLNNKPSIKVTNYSEESCGKRTSLDDKYNHDIERKIRLENKVEKYNDLISRVDKALEIIDMDMPIECKAIKMKYLENKSFYQMERTLSFGRTQCRNYLSRGENELRRLLEIVS